MLSQNLLTRDYKSTFNFPDDKNDLSTFNAFVSFYVNEITFNYLLLFSSFFDTLAYAHLMMINNNNTLAFCW